MIALLFVHNYNYPPTVVAPPTVITGPFSYSQLTEMFFSNSLMRFRLGLLMTISGYLMANSREVPYYLLVLKKMRTLLLPYVIISIVAVFTTLVFETIRFGFHNTHTTGMMGKSVWNFTFQDIVYHVFQYPLAFQLWYLKTIFLLSIFSPIIKWVLTKIPLTVLGITLIVWLSTNYLDGEIRDRAFFFYGLGYYLRLHNKDVMRPSPYFSPKLALVLLFVFSVVRTGLAFVHVEWHATLHYLLILLFKLIEIVGGYAVWFCFDRWVKQIVKQHWFGIVGNASFFIYAFHAPLINYINDYFHFNRAFDIPGVHLFVYTLLPVCLLPFLVIADKLTKKYLPAAYAIITGGRGNVPQTQQRSEEVSTKQA